MKRFILYILMSFVLMSCEDFLEVGPNTSQLETELVFKNDNTALAALEAIYHELQFNGFASGNAGSISVLSNTLGDDAIEYNTSNDRYDFYINSLRADNSSNNNIWSSVYTQMYRINALLEGINNNPHLSKESKNRIEGEIKFLRAFTYYYLVHFYGELPLVLTTDYAKNISLEKNTVEEVYHQIIQDLQDAIVYLPENYIHSNGEHIRPTKYAAYTLLARMALWQEKYDKAIKYSSLVINAGVYELIDLNDIFKANSAESIWQMVPVVPNTGANEGNVFILENNPATPNTASTSSLTNDFLNIWEPQDLRGQNWVGIYTEGDSDYHYPFKYKIKRGGDSEEYSMVLRLGELYLIRAEAEAKLGNTENALEDLNMLRNRAGLNDWTSTEVSNIEQAVLDERRRELFSEWGHRWLDLKRFGKLEEILGQKKPTWQSHAKLLPIPEQDILRNPFLTQNPGY